VDPLQTNGAEIGLGLQVTPNKNMDHSFFVDCAGFFGGDQQPTAEVAVGLKFFFHPTK
jgi:hypothetical protein